MEETGPINSVNALVWKVYWSALNVPLPEFRESTLSDLGRLIPFDAALWGTGEVDADRFHSLTLVGLNRRFSRTLERTKDINPMFEALVRQPNTAVDVADLIPDDRFYRCDIYRRICEPFNIQRVLGTSYRDPRTGLYGLVVLFRFDRARRFSPEERERQQHVVYHLMQAMSLGYSIHLGRVGGAAGRGGAAVCDRFGVCHDAQPAFRDLLESRYGPWEGTRLPFPVPDPAAHAAARHRGLRVIAEPVGDLFCVQLWPEGPMDRLTDRERQIVTSVCRGLSYKEVARPLGIAPSTVSNHLYRVYGKLGVTNRTELAKLVGRQ